ncbi:MAG: alpha/beta hydrolase [Myxococcota bacterium]
MDDEVRFSFAAVRTTWDVYPRDPLLQDWALPSRTRLYMFHGEYDSQTGLSGARESARELGVPLVEEPGGGHIVLFGSRCGRTILTQVAGAPDVSPDTTCLTSEGRRFELSEDEVRFWFGTSRQWD